MGIDKLKHRLVGTAICCVAVFALAILAPNIAAFGWHVIYPSRQRFGNYEIIVPQPFIAQKTSTGIRLVRARAAFSLAFYEFESIDLSQAPGQVDIEKWKLSALRALSDTGAKNVKGFEINIGGNPSICIERSQDDPSVKTIVLCKSSSNLTAEYFGNDSSFTSMQNVLQIIQRKPV